MINKIKEIIKLFLPEEILNKIKYKDYIKKNIVIGRNVDIQNSNLKQNSRFAYHCSVRNSEVGKYSSIGRYTKVNYAKVGKFCSISWDVTIGAINHPYDKISTHAFPYVPRIGFVNERNQEHKRVTIGNDVWIGCNSVIMPGIQIGDGAIIGAGAVVTKDIPDYAIAVGVPAEVKKYRFEKDLINRLISIQWWNFSDKTIQKNINIFKRKLDERIIEKLLDIKEDK
jgi:acetyltransferase-like isoleucine patch superfamily enzyme